MPSQAYSDPLVSELVTSLTPRFDNHGGILPSASRGSVDVSPQAGSATPSSPQKPSDLVNANNKDDVYVTRLGGATDVRSKPLLSDNLDVMSPTTPTDTLVDDGRKSRWAAVRATIPCPIPTNPNEPIVPADRRPNKWRKMFYGELTVAFSPKLTRRPGRGIDVICVHQGHEYVGLHANRPFGCVSQIRGSAG